MTRTVLSGTCPVLCYVSLDALEIDSLLWNQHLAGRCIYWSIWGERLGQTICAPRMVKSSWIFGTCTFFGWTFLHCWIHLYVTIYAGLICTLNGTIFHTSFWKHHIVICTLITLLLRLHIFGNTYLLDLHTLCTLFPLLFKWESLLISHYLH